MFYVLTFGALLYVKTWDGAWYDFHGQCDLVFLHNPEFGNGIGMDIHIRTTVREWFSFVESAAIRIGDDIMEVSGWGEFVLNGVDLAELPGKLADTYNVTYTFNAKMRRTRVHYFWVAFGDGKYVKIQSYKDIVAVKIHGATSKHFGGSVGLMGSFGTGVRLARDGKTILEDDIEFPQEWQVLSTEPKLFGETKRFPQHPSQCMMPTHKRPTPGLRERTA